MEERTDEMMEYITFEVKTKEGKTIEMAIVDEFQYEHKQYIAASVIDGDTITEGKYIYRYIGKTDDFTVQQINDPKEFERIAAAYLELEAE